MLLLNGMSNAQTLTLQPDAIAGKDALLGSFANTTNYGSHPDQNAVAWTNGGATSNHSQ